MNPATANILQRPFVQVALPILIGLMVAAWLQNKRFDDMNRRLDETSRRIDEFRHEVIGRLDRIEAIA